MMHGFQQIVTQAERRYNFVVHGLPPLRDEMAVSPLIWRKRLMDSISSNLGYLNQATRHWDIPCSVRYAHGCLAPPLFVRIAHATQRWTEIRMYESLVIGFSVAI